jgi:hypothetical protein
MSGVFFVRQIPITPELQVTELKNHANGFLRYNNINDLAHSGPQALTWFLNRANTLFKSNYPSALPTASLQLSYLSVFCRAEHEADSQALPVYDFLKIDIQPTGKSGYGVMFSSQMREYYRDRLENGMDTSEIPVDQAFFNSIFKQDSPKTGVLESYPVIMIPRSANEQAPSLTHTYLSSLGLDSRHVQPPASAYPFRFYFKQDLATQDPEVIAAISACGQAMFEIVRPHLYPLDQQDMPRFDMAHLTDIKWEQHNTARRWVAEHQPCVEALMALHGIRH